MLEFREIGLQIVRKWTGVVQQLGIRTRRRGEFKRTITMYNTTGGKDI